jgi:DnaJ-class molecular chaperone
MEYAQSLYEVLQVDANACPQVIRAAFRVLTQRNHPDKSAVSGAADDRQVMINHAYYVLSDPTRRQHYDQTMARCRRVDDHCGLGNRMNRSVASGASEKSGQRPFVFRALK